MSGLAPGPELSVIVPTFNERGNVAETVRRLHQCLKGYNWEVIFVDDDSPDGTSELARQIAAADNRVRCIQRIGRRGLSSACIEGMLASSAPYLAVMDGDLQHDEFLLVHMLNALKTQGVDLAIGSRYMAGGSTGTWSTSRINMSRFASRLSEIIIRHDLSDPMSGFFMIRQDAFRAAVRKLSGIGFKILLDLVASSPRPLKFVEMPYEFRSRQLGESKLDKNAVWEFGVLLMDKVIGHIVPVRFAAFALVGALGVLVHLLTQALLLKGMSWQFVNSQVAATLVAMTFNFAVNNFITYRDMQLKGWGWIKGWLSFCVACSVGAIANVGIAAYIFQLQTQWVLAAIAGILVGAVWNYAVTMVYTWKKPSGL